MVIPCTSILVVSDSHGNVQALSAALGWASKEKAAQKRRFASAIFLGDGEGDLVPASAQTGFDVPWHKVRGNVDVNFSLPGFLLLEIPALQCLRESTGKSSRKLFLAHGNRHGVNEGFREIASAAKAAGAEAALFGHTHAPHCSMLDGIFLLNPGSIGRSRSSAGPTFAVLECPLSGPLSARIFRLVTKSGKTLVEEIEI